MGTTVPAKRFANWDLLRSLAMLFVVGVHSLSLVSGEQSVPGLNADAVRAIVILCDPVFFMLSGFFAIRPMTRSWKDYYLNKVSTIILPLVLYAILLYLCRSLWNATALSLDSFFRFFSTELTTNWWFIPTLVPCLVVAPFISKGFAHLSDKQVFALGAVTLVIYLWGFGMTFLGWVADAAAAPVLADFSKLSLQIIPPGLLTGSFAFFQFFIMGGVFRRMAPHLHGRCGTGVIIAGLLICGLDVVFAVNGIPRISYSWMFITLGIMTAFDRIRIPTGVPSAVISWIGKRAYAIYLLQMVALSMVTRLIFHLGAFDTLSGLSPGAHIGLWLLAIFGAYGASLAAASVIDPLVLANLQKLFDRLFIAQRTAPASERTEKDDASEIQ